MENTNGKDVVIDANKGSKMEAVSSMRRINGNPIFYADCADANSIDHMDDYDYINMGQSSIKKQSMKGFGSYNNIVDYIVRITREIWKEKNIGLIYDTYSHGVQVHKGLINSHGVNEVVSGTLQTLHAFPDRKGLGWSVIWSGNDKDGFFTSHRGKSVATNLGDSLYGPATGKKVVFRTSADCMIQDNKIYEEWLVMDTYHLVIQLGFDPVEVAKHMALATAGLSPVSHFGFPETSEEGLPPKIFVPEARNFEIGEMMSEMINKIWQRRSFNNVKQFYSDNAVIHYVCNRDLVGYAEIQGLFISLFASLPTSKVLIDRITCNKKTESDWDVAVRWRIQGVHEGMGLFGSPSGKSVEIMGINHYKIRGEKIVEEWFLFDWMEVLRQIFIPSKDALDQTSETLDGNFTGVS